MVRRSPPGSTRVLADSHAGEKERQAVQSAQCKLVQLHKSWQLVSQGVVRVKARKRLHVGIESRTSVRRGQLPR
jgi:hypothetical protein